MAGVYAASAGSPGVAWLYTALGILLFGALYVACRQAQARSSPGSPPLVGWVGHLRQPGLPAPDRVVHPARRDPHRLATGAAGLGPHPVVAHPAELGVGVQPRAVVPRAAGRAHRRRRPGARPIARLGGELVRLLAVPVASVAVAALTPIGPRLLTAPFTVNAYAALGLRVAAPGHPRALRRRHRAAPRRHRSRLGAVDAARVVGRRPPVGHGPRLDPALRPHRCRRARSSRRRSPPGAGAAAPGARGPSRPRGWSASLLPIGRGRWRSSLAACRRPSSAAGPPAACRPALDAAIDAPRPRTRWCCNDDAAGGWLLLEHPAGSDPVIDTRTYLFDVPYIESLHPRPGMPTVTGRHFVGDDRRPRPPCCERTSRWCPRSPDDLGWIGQRPRATAGYSWSAPVGAVSVADDHVSRDHARSRPYRADGTPTAVAAAVGVGAAALVPWCCWSSSPRRGSAPSWRSRCSAARAPRRRASTVVSPSTSRWWPAGRRPPCSCRRCWGRAPPRSAPWPSRQVPPPPCGRSAGHRSCPRPGVATSPSCSPASSPPSSRCPCGPRAPRRAPWRCSRPASTTPSSSRCTSTGGSPPGSPPSPRVRTTAASATTRSGSTRCSPCWPRWCSARSGDPSEELVRYAQLEWLVFVAIAVLVTAALLQALPRVTTTVFLVPGLVVTWSLVLGVPGSLALLQGHLGFLLAASAPAVIFLLSVPGNRLRAVTWVAIGGLVVLAASWTLLLPFALVTAAYPTYVVWRRQRSARPLGRRRGRGCHRGRRVALPPAAGGLPRPAGPGARRHRAEGVAAPARRAAGGAARPARSRSSTGAAT